MFKFDQINIPLVLPNKYRPSTPPCQAPRALHTLRRVEENIMHIIIDEGITGGESSGEDTGKGKVIPDDDLIVQILARLDGSAYREALYQDAGVSIQCI